MTLLGIGGEENRFAMGAYPALSLAQARAKTDEARELVKEGIHPAHILDLLKKAHASKGPSVADELKRTLSGIFDLAGRNQPGASRLKAIPANKTQHKRPLSPAEIGEFMRDLALKHIFDPQPKQALAEILPLARQILDKDTALEMLEVLLRYYVQTTQTLDGNDIRDLPTETADDGDAMPAFIDRYIEQGRQQGLFMGGGKGREEGRREERQALLLRLMTRKFGALTPTRHRRIKQADGEDLLRWSERVLFAAIADEALR